MIVKVCGVRSAAIAECAIEAGADWLGLVFEPRSPRFVSDGEAAEVRRAARGRADLVGVVVEPPPARCMELADLHHLQAVQVHGRVDPALARAVDVPLIRAVNAAGAHAALTVEWWPDCPLLLDSPPVAPGAPPGGTGVRLDLEVAALVAAHRPLILAGGLTPDNVAEAIERVRPLGVDASSGLESRVGVKDPARVRAFVSAARAAFSRLAAGGTRA